LHSYKFTAHAKNYTDIYSFPSYSFGYGKSYSTFAVSGFNATSTHGVHTFSAGETIDFRVTVKNEGPLAGSYVPQVCTVPLSSAHHAHPPTLVLRYTSSHVCRP
jgi:hypothetical protein